MNGWLPFSGAAASAHAAEIDSTMTIVHLLMLALFVGWFAFFLFALFRFRGGRSRRAEARGVQSHASTWLEVGVALAEAVLLVGFSFPAWARRVQAFPPEGESTVVRVVAEQFAWNVHYPGPDGVFGRTDSTLVDAATNPLGLDHDDPHAKDDITTVNQLHLPVGRPAIIRLSSKDVIHSFGQHEMRVKQDAIPGLVTPLWFVPLVTTAEMRKIKGNPEYNYEIACAQLCGLGHYRMRGFMTIDSAEEWQAWLDERAAEAKETEDDSAWK